MVAYLVRNDLGRRWRAVLLLALLIALVLATVLAAVAGGRRSSTAYLRYAATINGPDAMAQGDPEGLRQLASTDGVEATLPFELVAAFPAGTPEDEFFPLAVSLDARVPYEYLRSPVTEGRQADPTAPLEIAPSERTAERLGLEVGDSLPLVAWKPDPGGTESSLDGPPDGPAIELSVVGIVRDPGDIGSRATDVTLTFISPAFRDVYEPSEVGSIASGSLVVLDPGARLSTISEAASQLGVELDTSVSADVARRQVQPTMSAIATALYVFAAVAGIAGLATIAHAMHRVQQPVREDSPTLLALGVDRRARAARLAAPAALALLVGTPLGMAASIVASPRFPVGLARRAEPAPGIRVDLTVLLLGGAAALLVGLLVVAAGAELAVRRAERPPASRVSRIGRFAASAGAPAPVVTGLTFGGSSGAGSVRPAAVGGVMLGVLGLLAAIGFASSIDHLVGTPSLYGWGWDGNVAGAGMSHVGDDERAEVARRVIADQDLAAVGSGVFQLAVVIDEEPLFGTAVGALRGRIEPVVVRGRAPSGANEVALARDTLSTVRRDVGDVVDVTFDASTRAMQIVGVVSLPVSADGGASTVGAFLPREAIDALGFETCDEEMSCYENLLFRVAPGVELAEIVDRYTDDELETAVDLPAPPGEVERLTAVQGLPWFLAGFLALLATVAVAYAATTTVRRGGRDLAVLHGLGMTAAQLRTVIMFLVLSISGAGAVVGTALGVVVGRVVWRWTMASVSLPFAPKIPIAALLLIPLATIALAQLAASLSRHQAGRVRAAQLLRAE